MIKILHDLPNSENTEHVEKCCNLIIYNNAIMQTFLTLTLRRLRPIRVANKTQTRDPLNFGPCKADWPAAFVIK